MGVTSHTSPVTLQVLGNVKCCLSIVVSVLVFKNELKGEQAIGVAVCLFGVWLYNKHGGVVKSGSSAASNKLEMPRVDEDKWKNSTDSPRGGYLLNGHDRNNGSKIKEGSKQGP